MLDPKLGIGWVFLVVFYFKFFFLCKSYVTDVPKIASTFWSHLFYDASSLSENFHLVNTATQ